MFKDEDTIIGLNSDVARRFGVQTATVYNRVGWLNNKNIDATVESVLEGFPFLTINQVKHSLRTLEKYGAVAVTQPGKNHFDNSKHYFACEVENEQI